ncbi:MAG: hypothetical protein ACFB15_16125 [Cyclobacteriaceae bacterium]
MKKILAIVAISLMSWSVVQAQDELWFEEMQENQEMFIHESNDEPAEILEMELPDEVLYALDQGEYQHLTITRARILNKRDQRRLQLANSVTSSFFMYVLLLED